MTADPFTAGGTDGPIQTSSVRRQQRLQMALIVMVALAAYAPAFGGYFLSDDFSVSLLLNAEKRAIDWSNTLSDLYTVFRGDPTHSYYRPMITLSAALDYTVWGLNPVGFHLTNLALHAINALLLYAIANAVRASSGGWFGFTAALLFILYPLHPEAIYWIAARSDTLMACFILSSLLLTLRAGSPPRFWPSAFSLFAFALALATKETAVVVPIAVVLAHAMRAASTVKSAQWDVKQEFLRLIPYLLLLIGYFLFRRAVTGRFVGQYGASGIDLLQLSSLPIGLVKFVAYQIHPAGSPLTALQGNVLFGPRMARTIAVAGWVATVGIVATAFAGRKDRQCRLALALMLLFVAPLLAIFAAARTPYEWSRLRYLPSTAFCLLTASLLDGSAPALRRGLTVTIVLTFAVLSLVNSLPWIYAGQLSRRVVQEIERAANRPGVYKVLLAGDPQGYLSAELFGGKSWALSLAAAPPFARIPHNVSVVNMATEQGRRLLQAARSQLLPFLVILRYDPARRSVEEVAPDDPSLG